MVILRKREAVLALAAMALLGTTPAGAQTAARPDAVATPEAKPWLTLDQLRARYRDRHGRIALIGGVEVYYKDEGKGPVVLLIHGSVSSLKTWDGVAARLVRQGYRVIRFDIPPQGLSGPVSAEALRSLKPTDIPEQLLAQRGVTKATAVGVSSGGTMAIQLAARRPDLIRCLIVSNAPADPVRTDKQVMTPRLEAAIAERTRLGFESQGFWDAFLDFYAGDPARYDTAFHRQIYDMNRRKPEPNQIALVAQVADQPKAIAAMNAVTQPVLLAWGGADPLLPYAAMDTLERHLIKAEVSKIRMPDVGHYPPVEVPDRFVRIIVGYIEGAVPDRPGSK